VADQEGSVPSTNGGLTQALTSAEREQVLAAATELFSKHGPGTVSLKWVALNSHISAELVSGTWPTVNALLDSVLDRLSAQFEELANGALRQLDTVNEAAVIETYERTMARSLLDGVNPASPLRDQARNDQWVQAIQARFGLDEHEARLRLSQTFALEWGWRLFGPHIKAACRLDDEPDAELIGQVRHLEQQILRLPPRRDEG